MQLRALRSLVVTALAAGLCAAGVGSLAQLPVEAQLQKPVSSAGTATQTDFVLPVRLQDNDPAPVQRKNKRAQLKTRSVNVERELAKKVSGPILRAVTVSKDCMVLSYLPDWNFGNVDNIGIGNNDGGVRTLVNWPEIPADEAESSERQFLIAVYSRKTIAHPSAGKIHAFEILEDWRELTSWKTQPRYGEEPVGTYKFEPETGWKLFDVTPLVRAQAKAERKGHGVLLRFLNEDVPGGPDQVFSDYKMVSREGAEEWENRRPLLLVVKATKD
jgi:hypothetical protein